MDVLLLYHSGTGGTKYIADMIHAKLQAHKMKITVMSIEEIKDYSVLEAFDQYIIGFPTYHTSPSASISNFIKKMEPLSRKRPTFIFTTCGLYSANTLRIFAKQCINKNMMVVMSNIYYTPASDGAMIIPFVKRFFRFERHLNDKIDRDVERITHEFSKKHHTVLMPRFKLYSFFNYPNKLCGLHLKFPIYLYKRFCIKCGKCINNCLSNSFSVDTEGYPVHDKINCEHCYRCIHHCPEQALSLSKKKRVEKQLDDKFWKEIKKQ